MKQLFFHELKQNVTRDIIKKYFHDERMKKVFPVTMVFDKYLFVRLSIDIYDNKMPHFENFNHASHLKPRCILIVSFFIRNKSNNLEKNDKHFSYIAFIIRNFIPHDRFTLFYTRIPYFFLSLDIIRNDHSCARIYSQIILK